MDVPAAHGGRDARVIDQVAAWEQLGRVTNALCWCFSEPHRWMFEACSTGAARALRAAAHDRQAQGMLRHHRERLGLGRRIDPDDRASHWPEGYRISRREVVRHERESRGLLHPAGAARGGAACRLAFDCSSSTRASRASRSCARRSSATRSATITRPIGSTMWSCRRTSVSAPKATACGTRTAGSAASG